MTRRIRGTPTISRERGIAFLRVGRSLLVRMDMIVRMPHAAFVNMRVRMRPKVHGVTLLDAAEFPHAHRQAPRHQEHADDQVAQYSEVEAGDEIGNSAQRADNADKD